MNRTISPAGLRTSTITRKASLCAMPTFWRPMTRINLLKITLKAEIDREAWESLHSDTSRPFDRPKSRRIAVKVINHLGDEVMKVYRVN